MEPIKKYFLKNFEQVFVLSILVSIFLITYFIPYKLAFLNFYYIPILLAAYYLGTRAAMLGAIFSVIMVSVYAYIYPSDFTVGSSLVDTYANIATWGGFLILSGAIIGYLNKELKENMYAAVNLDRELTDQKELLEKTSFELMEYTDSLEDKVAKRTSNLEQSKQAVEDLKDKVEQALYTTMDASVVKLMIEKRLRTEKRRISIMFCDLKGFTQFSEERRPEAVINDLNHFLADMEETLLNYQAHIDKYMGDGIMAEFGAPIDYERYAILAVAAALKMQQQVNSGDYPWKMRVGIATGEPIIGLIGNKRQSYTALGDVVNLASRIEELCTPGCVTIDEKTYQEIKRFFNIKQRLILPDNNIDDVGINEEINNCLTQLEENKDDLILTKKLAGLLMEVHEFNQANECYKQAMELDPGDKELKLAYADSSIKAGQITEVPIRGRKESMHLYEVESIVDPLKDRKRIPESLYKKFHTNINKLMNYPENLLLPIECIDGSIGHSRIVGFIAYAIAEEIDLPDQEKYDVLEAAYLADVGKTIIPHHLRNRRGGLSKDEFKEVTKHCRESVRMLKLLGYESEPIFEIILSHHENYRGGGYPEGLQGEDIPLGARIVTVADAFSALTSWRPYHEQWEYQAAFNEIETDMDKGKYDPKIVMALAKLLDIERETENITMPRKLAVNS